MAETKPTRTVTQIAVGESASSDDFYSCTIVALCNDGTIWLLDQTAHPPTPWRRLPPVPGTEP